MIKMKIDVDEISPVQRKIRVELPAETVAHEFSRAYQDLGRRVRVKGFRAGKTPRSVLQGIYGDELKGQVRSQLVEASLGEIIKERGLQIVSRPEIEANDLLEDRPFSFSAVFEVKPDIPVKDYLGVEVARVKLSVSDEQVDQALKRLQESHARLEPVENRALVQRGDFVTLDFEGSIAGKPFPGGKGQNYLVEIGGGRALPQFEEALIGLKQEAPEKIRVVYPEHYPNNELSGKAVDFSVIVREIKQKVMPELDDDFAKDHGECASLQDLKAVTRTRLEHEVKQIQQEELKEQIISELIRACPLTPPAAMVERQTRYLMERYHNRGTESAAGTSSGPSPEEARKTLEGRALRQVQATLLVEKISQLEKIEVSDQDVQERVDYLARAAADKAKAVRDIYSKPDARDDLRAQLVFDRTLSFLLERAHIKVVESLDTKVDEQAEKG
jgi:trigger factor